MANAELNNFNEDLARHMTKHDEADERSEWIEEKTKELLAGEYNPFLPNNVQEAIAEMSFDDACLLGAYVGTAAKLKDNASAQVHCSEFIVMICTEYWEKAAKHHVEIDYDNR